jgi:hypothetical protein
VLHLFGFMVEQGAHPFVQILFGAVVGVQGDGDVGVFRRDFVREGCEGKRAGDAVVDAPPTETWMMPSDSASAKPWSAAFRVCVLVTLIAG